MYIVHTYILVCICPILTSDVYYLTFDTLCRTYARHTPHTISCTYAFTRSNCRYYSTSIIGCCSIILFPVGTKNKTIKYLRSKNNNRNSMKTRLKNRPIIIIQRRSCSVVVFSLGVAAPNRVSKDSLGLANNNKPIIFHIKV